MLENQQAQLVQALRKLYRRVNSGQGWVGAPLRETNGSPLTHDVLERLGVLKQEGQAHSAPFEEDFLALQCPMIAEGAGYMQSGMYFDTNLEVDQSLMSDPAADDWPTFTYRFASHCPPTPPGSPHASVVKKGSPFKIDVNTAAPQPAQKSLWQIEPLQIDSMNNESPSSDAYMQAMNLAAQRSTQMFQETTGMTLDPCMSMKNWHGLDDNMQPYYPGSVCT